MITILDIVTKKLQFEVGLLPLQEGEVVEFKLIRAGVKNLVMGDGTDGGKPTTPAGHGLAAYDNIRDYVDEKSTLKADKEIMNIVSYRSVREPGKKTFYDPIARGELFPRTGSIHLGSDQNNLYYYLMLHNKNRDNPNRRGGKIYPVFYRVDEKKEKLAINAAFDYKIIAGNILMDVGVEDLASLVRNLNVANRKKKMVEFDLKSDQEKLITELKLFTEQHPLSVIFSSNDKRAKMRVVVDTAIMQKWVLFDEHPEKREWILNLTKVAGSKVKSQAICKVDAGNNYKKALVDFLDSKDGSTTWTTLNAIYEEKFSK